MQQKHLIFIAIGAVCVIALVIGLAVGLTVGSDSDSNGSGDEAIIRGSPDEDGVSSPSEVKIVTSNTEGEEASSRKLKQKKWDGKSKLTRLYENNKRSGRNDPFIELAHAVSKMDFDDPGTDYSNTEAYVTTATPFDSVTEIVDGVMCIMNQMGMDLFVNVGPYLALVDNNICSEGSGDPSDSSGAPDLMSVYVEATRADADSPQIGFGWVPPPETGDAGSSSSGYSGGGYSGPSYEVKFELVLYEPPSLAHPNGVGKLLYAAILGGEVLGVVNIHMGQTAGMPADWESADVTLSLDFSDAGMDMVYSISAVAGYLALSGDSYRSEGQFRSAYIMDMGAYSMDLSYSGAYNADYMIYDIEGEGFGALAEPECMSRGDANVYVSTYGLFDEDGARVELLTDFSFDYESDGESAWGYYSKNGGIYYDSFAAESPDGKDITLSNGLVLHVSIVPGKLQSVIDGWVSTDIPLGTGSDMTLYCLSNCLDGGIVTAPTTDCSGVVTSPTMASDAVAYTWDSTTGMLSIGGQDVIWPSSSWSGCWYGMYLVDQARYDAMVAAGAYAYEYYSGDYYAWYSSTSDSWNQATSLTYTEDGSRNGVDYVAGDVFVTDDYIYFTEFQLQDSDTRSGDAGTYADTDVQCYAYGSYVSCNFDWVAGSSGYWLPVVSLRDGLPLPSTDGDMFYIKALYLWEVYNAATIDDCESAGVDLDLEISLPSDANDRPRNWDQDAPTPTDPSAWVVAGVPSIDHDVAVDMFYETL